MLAARLRSSCSSLPKRLVAFGHRNASFSTLITKNPLVSKNLLKSSTFQVVRFESTEASPETKENTFEFKAETKKLLHIVAHSLYSQREVFVRELISNSSDALEKLRYLSLSRPELSSDNYPEIRIDIDKEKKTISFQDYGIGMTESELIENLGTIARSGSKKYVENLNDGNESPETAKNIVGQFGVGFYSGFMIGDTMEVYSKSAEPDSQGFCWKSDGLGYYTLKKVDDIPVGTKVVIHVKDDAKEFLDASKISEITKKYSNFVSFPILVNNEKVNTTEALWLKNANSITEKEHEDFFKHITNGFEEPLYKLVYRIDAPISIRSLLYIPKTNPELMGFQKTTSGVSLYSRKVLVMPNSDAVLPEWLRVVDSEDLPLNLSRELLQQGTLMQKIKTALSSRIVKWLRDEAKKDPESYKTFYKTFGNFLKEGVISDIENRNDIAGLLRFTSSKSEDNEQISLKDYISRMKSDQKDIFYLTTPTKAFGEQSPYFEPFKNLDIEVIFLTSVPDEYALRALQDFNKMKILSIDSEEARTIVSSLEKPESLDGETDAAKDEAKSEVDENLTSKQGEELSEWFRTTLGMRVDKVKIAPSSSSFPAIVTNFESPAMRRMMKMMLESTNTPLPPSPCTLEINLKNPIIKGLYKLKSENATLAEKVAEQVFDNAVISAGIMDDPRVMVGRLNDILLQVVKK
ncbi:hypothetical protein BB560_005345 [Smittium megazygosporum]|uniref:Histidine kinase/HSP90-like ATPase domain-containing protein n=1 Tax=Smittium megazygosporum TaxID=133381 RepID=A0A2T9Z6P5_9FUNG|nr:hypothetical protein BB560_005345 [Smittium megazygosporum]